MCMINKIGIDTTGKKINSIETGKDKKTKVNPNFKGLGTIALSGIQACERMPMVNVAVVDMLSAILPRTIVESMTNWYAGFEAFRRESSGLVVNCLIPSYIAWGIAKCINGAFMPNGVNMSNCWADSSLIDKASEYYKNANSDDKIKEALKNIISDTQGIESKEVIKFKEALSAEELEKYSTKLAEIARSNKSDRKTDKEVKQIANKIIEKTRVAENIKMVNGKSEVRAASVTTLLQDSVKFYKGLNKAGNISIEEFARKNKNLIKSKSWLGLAIVLPLAASMQYINRWITSKVSGVKGAPIYDDFGKGKTALEEDSKEKEGLLKQKLISISSMIGVGLLSMMKKPTFGMLEFKGWFPTMDQARIISTTTFASRMAVAEDKNELAEATVRDIATFSSLYFLGDYAAKAAASIIQNKTGITLLNDTKPVDKKANAFKKAWHWIKDINIKSSEEVISPLEESLKKQGKTATKDQLETIGKELKKARNLRSACQVANLGVSLALLGIVIPIFTRKNTKKKHEQALKLAQEKTQVEIKDQKPEPVTPLDIQYHKLTAGFRADKR